MNRRAALTTLLAPCLAAQTQFLPVSQLSPGMAATARTVFTGQTAEEFPVRILGVLRNTGPNQNLILGRLLTARLEQTGVMQGMSGSPVYVEGRLIGAIAFAFPFAKEPIAGIRPIEEMLRSAPVAPPAIAQRIHLGSPALFSPSPQTPADGPVPVLTPVSLAGFTPNTLRHFAAGLRDLGFALQQGAGGAAPTTAPAQPLAPGDMISVQLLRGDLNAGADGTVTHVDGDRIFAFGHRFLAAGNVELPFARAEVVTPLPNLNQSFKISQSLAPAGTIQFDGDAAISGRLGPLPKLTPLRIRFLAPGANHTYNVEMARHALLSPLLLQMAIFSTLDHHFHSAGAGSIDVEARFTYPNLPAPLVVGNRYSGDNNLPLAVSLGAALPYAFLQQNSPESLLPAAIELTLAASPERTAWVLEQLTADRHRARPGSSLTLTARLRGPAGEEQLHQVPFAVPAWLEAGQTLTITAADAFTTNLLDFRSFYQPGGPSFRSSAHLIETINRLHPNNSLHFRAFRAAPAFQSAGQELGNLPPSVASTLQRTPGAYLPTYQSRLLDRRILLPTGTVSGSRYLTLEIEK